MKVIKEDRKSACPRGAVVTIGNFDGLHLGHRRVIKKTVERARSLGKKAVVYTFDPHPLKVVSPKKSPPLIMTLEEKIKHIESLGVNCLVLARFTKGFASTHPRMFVEDVLVKTFAASEVWVGHDYSFGRSRLGTADYLKELGRSFGFKVFVVPALKRGAKAVSSSRIRRLVLKGDVEGAEKLLGRPFSVTGVVVRGDDRGRQLGFPTANIKPFGELEPGCGVYAGRAFLEKKWYNAAVNIGMAPTFGRKHGAIEAHLPGFEGSLYGKTVTLEFVKRIRGERHFLDADALKRRIAADVKEVIKALRR